ncbi:MAG: phosphoglycerate kinase [Gracilibacteraceae bacterium]|jgi:phosphoglycerate kinase|nr:phosphoglycerate kinase [Gracilibacteraceae bacterium]
MNKLRMDEVDVQGKRVLVRVDFNVPMNEAGDITDDTRIRAALPSVEYLIAQGAKVILASHLGRPKGKVNAKYSLTPVAQRLSELLNRPVAMAKDCVGEDVRQQAHRLRDGDVLLLENLRFHPQEEENDREFAVGLAKLAEIFVNDAFGTAHRAHASTAGVASYIPAVAGFLMSREVDIMGRALENPERPFAAVIGGAKVSDKIDVIRSLLSKVDTLIVGGGMANTFLRAQGYDVGKSLCETEKTDLARELLELAGQNNVRFLLPEDVVVAKVFDNDAPSRVVTVSGIEADDQALDIGPASVAVFAGVLAEARTVIWNGPMGVFEMPSFANGTREIAKAVAKCAGVSIVGGGDSVAAVEGMGLASAMTHISTGGGASLEFLEGKVLPGVAVLQSRDS